MVRTRATTTLKRKADDNQSNVVTSSNIDGGGSLPPPTRPWLLPALHSSEARPSWRRYGTTNKKALGGAESKANKFGEISSTTEIYTPCKVPDLPPALPIPVFPSKILSPKAPIRGQLTENMSDPTIKDEEHTTETPQPLGIDKFLSDINQTPAQEEPRLFTTHHTPSQPIETIMYCVHKETDTAEPNTGKPTPSISLNLTTLAAKAENESDSEEVDSAFNPDFVTVGDYKVKTEFGCVLTEIISKHGDIASSCFFHHEMRSNFLEVLCDIVQELKKLNFKEVKVQNLKSMLERIDDMEKIGMRVGWLHKRVAEIDEAKAKFKQGPSIKLARKKNKEAIDETVKEMFLLEKKLDELKKEKEIIANTALETITIVKKFYNRPLLNGIF